MGTNTASEEHVPEKDALLHLLPRGQVEGTSQEVGQIAWDKSPVFHCSPSVGLQNSFSIISLGAWDFSRDRM